MQNILNMSTYKYHTLILMLILLIISCEKEDKDDIPPAIDMSAENHNPANCDTVYIGEAFVFKATFTDNNELGAYSIDIHHNFDHHTHSTQPEHCELDPQKEPTEDVFVFIETYDIPSGSKKYDANDTIFIPNDVDTGDYHFFVSLTDKEGWQTVKGISIKIMDRD